MGQNMIRLTLISAFLCYCQVASGCQCAKRIGSNFLNQVKNFDLIVLGIFRVEPLTDKATFEIERIYKGETHTKTIGLVRGGLDCNHLLLFEDGQRILIGLKRSPYPGRPNDFVANGCVTSALNVTNGRATTIGETQALPAIGRQRIGFFAGTMKLETIEKQIKRR